MEIIKIKSRTDAGIKREFQNAVNSNPKKIVTLRGMDIEISNADEFRANLAKIRSQFSA